MFFFHACALYCIKKKKKGKIWRYVPIRRKKTKDKLQSTSVSFCEVLCRPRHNSNRGYEETLNRAQELKL